MPKIVQLTETKNRMVVVRGEERENGELLFLEEFWFYTIKEFWGIDAGKYCTTMLKQLRMQK